MPRPIVMTEAMKKQALEDFTTSLDKIKMTDGKFSYNRNFQYKNGEAIVWITSVAYEKILALITEFTDEVAWHGIVVRDDIAENEFTVEDIFVYPQEVTGSTVVTD